VRKLRLSEIKLLAEGQGGYSQISDLLTPKVIFLQLHQRVLREGSLVGPVDV
jgi:hypothetical protein